MPIGEGVDTGMDGPGSSGDDVGWALQGMDADLSDWVVVVPGTSGGGPSPDLLDADLDAPVVSLCPGNTPRAGTNPLIDDLESGTMGKGRIPSTDGRNGSWYTYNDQTPGAMQTPAAGTAVLPVPGGPAGSGWAMHTSGDGNFTTWGAGLALPLDLAAGQKNCGYDAGTYNGISFWAKGPGMIHFYVVTSTTLPVSDGGKCPQWAADAGKCNNNFGASISLTSDWAQYAIKWADLTRSPWGYPATFDEHSINSILWQAAKATAFDFWVDDVAFTGTGTMTSGPIDASTQTDGGGGG